MTGPMQPSFDSDDVNFPGSGGSAAPVRNPAAEDCYVNPVLDEDFPDPAIIHAPDGYYYAYATQTLRDGKWINIQVARSKDLVRWEDRKSTRPNSSHPSSSYAVFCLKKKNRAG